MNELQRLRHGFERGLYTRDDVRAWVDRQLAELSELPNELLELATMAHLDDVTVSHLLAALGGAASPAEEAQHELTIIAALFRRGSLTEGHAIDRLYQLCVMPGIEEAQRDQIGWIDCAYALAAEGTAGSLAEVRRELEDFLARY